MESELPFGIEQQYQAAVQRTGETDTLISARDRIAWMLKAGPAAVEAMMRDQYQRMK
jgi:hypothetical protein